MREFSLMAVVMTMAMGIIDTNSAIAAEGPKDQIIEIGVATMAPARGKISATLELKEPIIDKNFNPPFIKDAKGQTVGNPKWIPTSQVRHDS